MKVARAQLAGLALAVVLNRSAGRAERAAAVRDGTPVRRRGQGLAEVMAIVGILTVTAAFLAHHRSGPVQIEATPVDATADLHMADTLAVGPSSTCDVATPYVDDQTTDLMEVGDATPGLALTRYLCVRNAGTDAADIAVRVIETQSTESGCTSDEPELDPDGPGCGAAGELAADIDVTVTPRGVGPTGSCAQTPGTPVTYDGVADSAFSTLGPAMLAGEAGCYRVDVAYPVATPLVDVLRAQTDRVSWRLRLQGSSNP